MQTAYKDANNDLPGLNLNTTLAGLTNANTKIAGAPLANDPDLTQGEFAGHSASAKSSAPLNYWSTSPTTTKSG